MTTDTDKLRELALKATPGPYYLRTNRHPNIDGTKWGWLDLYESGSMNKGSPSGVNVTWSQGEQSHNNASFLAAANPTAILALLDELDRLRTAIQWEQNRSERIGTHGENCHTWGANHYECLLRENERLQKEVKAAHLAGYRLAREQAAQIVEEGVDRWQSLNHIRAMQPPAEWGTG